MNERSRVDKTSAEDNSIGFDYQYYHFLNELLNLKSDQTADYEVLDDVHIECADGMIRSPTLDRPKAEFSGF